jgi:hypothetical protein
MTLTNGDLKAIKNLMRVTIDESCETVLATKEEIKHLPTKEEYYDQADKIMTELSAVRDEITVLSDLQRQVHDHDTRISRVEKKLSIQSAF